MKNTKDDSVICQYCPCDCDGNCEHNKKTTGYSFIPDPEYCKKTFKEQKPDISWDLFLKAVFELHGSTVNKDWHRWLDKQDTENNDEVEVRQWMNN